MIMLSILIQPHPQHSYTNYIAMAFLDYAQLSLNI